MPSVFATSTISAPGRPILDLDTDSDPDLDTCLDTCAILGVGCGTNNLVRRCYRRWSKADSALEFEHEDMLERPPRSCVAPIAD